MNKAAAESITPRIDAKRRWRRSPRPLHRRRWPWVWLAIGTALLPFANLQTLIPLTAWLAPVFLLRFTRDQRLLVGYSVLVLAMSGALFVALRNGFFPVLDGPGYYLFIATLAIGGALPFAVDRVLAPRLAGIPRTLVFPAAVTTVEFLGTIGNPFGTAGSTAYSQYAGLPLLQLVSVTGIWGLTFLVSWFAPVVNEAWERGRSSVGAISAIGLFAAVTVSALLFGGVRLAFSAPDAETVRVAALAPDRHLSELAYSAPDLEGVSPAERASKRDEHFAPVLDELFSRSEQEAIGGAKIIAWSEAAARTMEEDQANVVARAADLARKHGVYLQVSMIMQLAASGSAGGPENENHAVLLDPTGAVVWDYQKSKPTPGDGHDPGPGIIPTVDTPYGRLATIICQDDFFPELVRQAGAAQVDILLLPSSDWDSVSDWHAQQAPFRAIENGASVVRPTRQGTSLATDSQGRLLGYKPDYFVAEEQTLVASVPVEGASTWYSVGGDAFAWACTAGLLVLIAAGLRPRRHRDR